MFEISRSENLPREIVSCNYPAASSVTLRSNYQNWNELAAWQAVFIRKPQHLAWSRFSTCDLTNNDLCDLKFKKVISVAPEMEVRDTMKQLNNGWIIQYNCVIHVLASKLKSCPVKFAAFGVFGNDIYHCNPCSCIDPSMRSLNLATFPSHPLKIILQKQPLICMLLCLLFVCFYRTEVELFISV